MRFVYDAESTGAGRFQFTLAQHFFRAAATRRIFSRRQRAGQIAQSADRLSYGGLWWVCPWFDRDCTFRCFETRGHPRSSTMDSTAGSLRFPRTRPIGDVFYGVQFRIHFTCTLGTNGSHVRSARSSGTPSAASIFIFPHRHNSLHRVPNLNSWPATRVAMQVSDIFKGGAREYDDFGRCHFHSRVQYSRTNGLVANPTHSTARLEGGLGPA